jgi:hypothetical protein
VGQGAWISIDAAQLEIQDAQNPVVTEQPSGPLLGPAVEGVQSLKLSAEDRGGGLASAVLLMDGHAVASSGPDAPAPKCAVPYIAPVPCPLKTSFVWTSTHERRRTAPMTYKSR